MLKNVLQSLLSRGTVAIVNLLILILSSKYLGLSSRGEISLFILNLSIVQVVCSVYTGYSIIHFVPRFGFSKILRDGIFFTIVFAALSNSIIVFLNKQVPGYEWMGYFVSLLVILNTFNSMLLLGKEKVTMFNFLSVLQPVLLLTGIAFFVLVFKVYTIEAYLFPLIFSFTIAFILSSYLLIRFLKPSGLEEYKPKEIILNGIYFQAGILMYLFSSRFSYYLLPNRDSVGLFSSAVVLTESVLIIANGIAPAMLSLMANRKNSLQNAELSLSFAKLSFILSFFGLLIIFLLPESLFISLLGNGFKGLKALVNSYIPGVLAMSLFIPLSNFFTASGQQKTTLLCYSAGLISTLIVAPVLVQTFGTQGAVYTANISCLFITFIMLAVFILRNKFSWNRFFMLKEDISNFKKLESDYVN